MKIMVVSPHPDDETLGAAGTLLRYKAEGNQIYWLNITNIEKSDNWNNEFIEKRKRQIEAVCHFYQFAGFYDLGFEPTTLESIDKSCIIKKISECFQKVQPEWIIIPDGNDAHSDHKMVYECCLVCSKVFRYPYIKRITSMEIISETDFGRPENPFIPNLYIDISDYMDKKIEILKIYDSEMGEKPFPRNMDAVRALGTLRGGIMGSIYAEAFKLIKEIK